LEYGELTEILKCSFTTLDQQNAQKFSLDIYIIISHWTFLFRSARDRHQGIKQKQYSVKPN